MDGEDQRVALRGRLPEHAANGARLTQVEAVEGLIHQEQRVRRDQSERQQEPAIVALRQGLHALAEDGRQAEPSLSREHLVDDDALDVHIAEALVDGRGEGALAGRLLDDRLVKCRGHRRSVGDRIGELSINGIEPSGKGNPSRRLDLQAP